MSVISGELMEKRLCFYHCWEQMFNRNSSSKLFNQYRTVLFNWEVVIETRLNSPSNFNTTTNTETDRQGEHRDLFNNYHQMFWCTIIYFQKYHSNLKYLTNKVLQRIDNSALWINEYSVDILVVFRTLTPLKSESWLVLSPLVRFSKRCIRNWFSKATVTYQKQVLLVIFVLLQLSNCLGKSRSRFWVGSEFLTTPKDDHTTPRWTGWVQTIGKNSKLDKNGTVLKLLERILWHLYDLFGWKKLELSHTCDFPGVFLFFLFSIINRKLDSQTNRNGVKKSPHWSPLLDFSV